MEFPLPTPWIKVCHSAISKARDWGLLETAREPDAHPLLPEGLGRLLPGERLANEAAGARWGSGFEAYSHLPSHGTGVFCRLDSPKSQQEEEISIQQVHEGVPLGSAPEGGKEQKWDWDRGQSRASIKVSSNPSGCLKLEWLFRVVPKWSKGVRPFYCCPDQSRAMALGNSTQEGKALHSQRGIWAITRRSNTEHDVYRPDVEFTEETPTEDF